MLDTLNLENILFLDIETVPAAASLNKLSAPLQELWNRKCEGFKKLETDSPASLYARAGIYAEFGKIICISVGIVTKGKYGYNFRIKSFFGHDEKKLLKQFIELLDSHYSKKTSYLCAHNGKEFDFPFMSRRMLLNGLKLPVILNVPGKKPWEVSHLDTMDLWRFGDYKNYTSLTLLAEIFNIKTPKDDMDGSQVYKVYYEERNLERIVKYCQKDVLTVAQLLLKYRCEELIKEKNITVA
jgi:uncharacterized protein YprB with RNaseH-like and TPR domain